MNTPWMKVGLLLILAIGSLVAINQTDARNQDCQLAGGTITQAEADSLVFMREEEKLARDVYLAMFEKWQTGVFSNIAASEQNHMDALKRLLDAYGLDDPIQDIGVFTNPELQELYNTLIAQGTASELAALQVGALIEEVDIQDLNEALSQTSLPCLQRVYQNLLNASENHLRAFVRYMATNEEPYIAQRLSQEEVDTILTTASSNQRGRGGKRFAQCGYSCQNCQGTGLYCNALGRQNRIYIDENGDGVCDNTNSVIQIGKKKNQGSGKQSTRRGRRGN